MAIKQDIDVFGDAPEGAAAMSADPEHPRLWARFLAKWFDFQFAQIITVAVMFAVLFLYGLVGVGIFGLPLPADSLFEGYGYVATYVAGHALIFILAEALFISLFGNTPGKALMGIRVTNIIGDRLGFMTSLKRSFASVAAGLAFGIPLVLVVTQAIQANSLNTNGHVFWDKYNDLHYTTRPVAWWRWTIGIMVYVAFRAFEVAQRYSAV